MAPRSRSDLAPTRSNRVNEISGPSKFRVVFKNQLDGMSNRRAHEVPMVLPPTVLDPNQLDIGGPPEIKRLRWIIEPPDATAANSLGMWNMDRVLIADHVFQRILKGA